MMENLQAIKSRLQAVQNIQKSANAMKLISSIKLAKLKKHDINSTKTTIEILKRALTNIAAEALYYDKFSTMLMILDGMRVSYHCKVHQ